MSSRVSPLASVVLLGWVIATSQTILLRESLAAAQGNELAIALALACRPALVIADSLIRIHSAAENSATEMAVVFATIRDLQREFPATWTVMDCPISLSPMAAMAP